MSYTSSFPSFDINKKVSSHHFQSSSLVTTNPTHIYSLGLPIDVESYVLSNFFHLMNFVSYVTKWDTKKSCGEELSENLKLCQLNLYQKVEKYIFTRQEKEQIVLCICISELLKFILCEQQKSMDLVSESNIKISGLITEDVNANTPSPSSSDKSCDRSASAVKVTRSTRSKESSVIVRAPSTEALINDAVNSNSSSRSNTPDRNLSKRKRDSISLSVNPVTNTATKRKRAVTMEENNPTQVIFCFCQ